MYGPRLLRSLIAESGGAGKVGSFITGGIARGDGAPVAVRVVLTEMNSTRAVAETVSSASGEWEVQGVRMGQLYSARIRDNSRQLNGAVLDWLQPVPM